MRTDMCRDIQSHTYSVRIILVYSRMWCQHASPPDTEHTHSWSLCIMSCPCAMESCPFPTHTPPTLNAATLSRWRLLLTGVLPPLTAALKVLPLTGLSFGACGDGSALMVHAPLRWCIACICLAWLLPSLVARSGLLLLN